MTMIVIGRTYEYQGKEVTVDDGDRLEQLWDITIVATGKTVKGIATSELKEKKK